MVRGWPYALRHMPCVSRSASVVVVEPDSRVLSSEGVVVPECACVLVQLEPCREHGRVCGAWTTQVAHTLHGLSHIFVLLVVWGVFPLTPNRAVDMWVP